MKRITSYIILVFALFSARSQDPWQGVSYYANSDKPYGLTLWRELVYNAAESFDEVDEGLEDFLEDREGETYITVSSFLDYSHKDADALVDFVERGNTAYIATNSLNGELFRRLTDTLTSRIEVFGTTMPNTSFRFKTWSRHKVTFKYNQKVYKHRWTHLSDRHFKYPVKVLGTTQGSYPVLVELTIGSGKLYLCSVPYAFLNVALADKGGLETAEALFPIDDLEKVVFDQKILLFHHYNTPSYLSETNVSRTVYIPPKPKSPQSSGGGSGINQSEVDGPKSSFSYIFAQRHLRSAYLILLVLGLLYVLNSARRKHRIMPLYKRNRTSEVAHMQLLSNFYFKSGDARAIYKHLDVSFRMIIRNRMQINLSAESSEGWKRLKAKFTGNPAIVDHLQKLQLQLSKKKDVSQQDIIEYNRTIEQILAKLN